MLNSEKSIIFANVIELERHIEILLLGNDCVVVPGLGGFVAHPIVSRYDEQDGVFLPPLRTLGFNPKLMLNDSLLAQSYVEAYDISYPEALRRIEQEVKQLQKQLSDEGYYELNGIGTLSINEEGKREFTPYEAGILTPEFYGLNSFDIQPLSASASRDKKKGNKAEAIAISTARHSFPTTETNTDKQQSELPLPAPKARIIGISQDKQTGKKFVSISLNAIRNMAVAAVLVAAFLITAPINLHEKGFPLEELKSGVFYNIFSKKESANREAMTKPKANEKAISSQPTAKGKSSPSQNRVNGTKPAVPSNAAQQPSEYWCIVLCSHVGLNNANNYSELLHQEGFPEAIVIDAATNAKVVYGKYATKEEAQQVLHSKQDNKYFKQGWLLKIQP